MVDYGGCDDICFLQAVARAVEWVVIPRNYILDVSILSDSASLLVLIVGLILIKNPHETVVSSLIANLPRLI